MSAFNSRESSTPDITVEGTTGVTVSRRAGNLWTAEARDDMFNRRERGEPWESICHDYPSRSRHAMQQQYSMMKKQRMMAEGTWTNNRRGRKRKVPPTATTPSVGLRRESGLETTEDEFASVTPSDLDQDDPDDMAVDDMDLGTPAPEANGHSGPSQSILDFRPGRPSGLSRSATDPASAPRGRGRGRGRAASAYHADGGHQALAPKGFTAVNDDRDGSYRHHYVDGSGAPAAKRQKSQIGSPSAEATADVRLPLNDSAVYFTRDDVLNFFKKGVEQADRLRKLMEEESAAREKAFQEAQGRANRRAYEAEDRIKETGYRHRSDMRVVEINFQEKIDALRQRHKEEIQQLKEELAKANGTDPSEIKIETKSPTTATDAAEPSDGDVAKLSQDPSVESKHVMALVTNLEELKNRFEAERELRKKAEAKATAAAQENTAVALQNVAPEFLHEFGQLEALVSRLNSDVGDLTPNALAKSLSDIRARCIQCASHFKSPSRFASPQAPDHSRPSPPLHSHGPPQPQPVPPHSQAIHQETGGQKGFNPHMGPAPLSHGSTNPHLAPMQVYATQTPPPVANTKPQESYHNNPPHHPGLPTPSEPPFENQTFEQKRSTPVSIQQLLTQEPAVVPPPNMPPQAAIMRSPPYEPSRPTYVPTGPVHMVAQPPNHAHHHSAGSNSGPILSPIRSQPGGGLPPIKNEQHENPQSASSTPHMRQHSNHWP